MKQYKELCKIVEQTAGLTPSTPKQFEELAIRIHTVTGKLMSPTTLKRIWGYLDEATSTRRSTLDILARFCGWKDFTDFEEGSTPEAESGNVGSKTIHSEKDMKRGERLRLFWNPARVCLIEYRGNGSWIVIESVGTRLKEGDTFNCHVIAEGEPLYLDNLMHDSIPSGVYVCGRKSGIRFNKEP